MTAITNIGRDLHGNRVSPGDVVTRFKGGRYDRIDTGIVQSVTGKGNLRIRIVHSTRREDVELGSVVLADWTRTVLIVVPPERRKRWEQPQP